MPQKIACVAALLPEDRAHPAIDALETRIQANVTVYRMGNGFVIEAPGFAKAGSGTTIPRAVAIFLFHNGLDA